MSRPTISWKGNEHCENGELIIETDTSRHNIPLPSFTEFLALEHTLLSIYSAGYLAGHYRTKHAVERALGNM